MSRDSLARVSSIAGSPNAFTQEQLKHVCEYFFSLTGNVLSLDKRSLIESRLRKRLIATHTEQNEYFKLLEQSEAERAEFVTALTTHKTDWFREKVHLEFLAERASDPDFQSNLVGPVSVWSAACSTGEEPYSIAMALMEAGIGNYRVLGTDISRECVESARKAVYKKSLVDQQVPEFIKRKYFLRGTGANQNSYRFDPALSANFKFREFNLVNSVLMSNLRFDFIFLRNVLIYFDQEAGYEIVKRLSSYLKPGGYFILGLSEAVTKPEKLDLKKIGNSTFQLCR